VHFDRNGCDADGDGLGDVCDADAFAAAIALGDLSGDGVHEHAALQGDANGATLHVVNGAHGALVDDVQVLGVGDVAHDVALVEDGAGATAIAVLARDAAGVIRVLLGDPASGTVVDEHAFFDATWSPIALAVVPDAGPGGETGLAVLAQGDAGSVRAELRAVADGTLIEAHDLFGAGAACGFHRRRRFQRRAQPRRAGAVRRRPGGRGHVGDRKQRIRAADRVLRAGCATDTSGRARIRPFAPGGARRRSPGQSARGSARARRRSTGQCDDARGGCGDRLGRVARFGRRAGSCVVAREYGRRHARSSGAMRRARSSARRRAISSRR
jgi:hypothetical protein